MPKKQAANRCHKIENFSMKFGSNWHKRTADKSGVETKFHCSSPLMLATAWQFCRETVTSRIVTSLSESRCEFDVMITDIELTLVSIIQRVALMVLI